LKKHPQHFLFLIFSSKKIIAAGKIRMIKIKFIGIIAPANMPKAAIGMSGLKMFAANATAVVEAVTVIALTALLHV
jgi:hypothetical protein